MRRLVVKAEENYRIDRFIIRAFGKYSWNKIIILKHFNPSVDWLLFVTGTPIVVPDDEEIAEIKNYRAYYELIRK